MVYRLALLIGCLLSLSALAQTAPSPLALDQEEALRFSRSVIGQMPADYAFIDSSGRPVRLSEYRGQPVLLNFIYSGCYKICPTSSRALRRAVLGMRDRFGDRQFQVLSVGFDQPTDSPMALRDFAARQAIDDANWAFLSPAGVDVPALARDFGFRYQRTPIGYEHTLQVSILDADGRIHEQVYGDAFGPDSLGEPLRRMLGGALLERPASLSDFLDKVRILCSVYDPLTGEYRVDYSLYLELAGGFTFLACMLWLVWSEWRNRRRLARAQTPGASVSRCERAAAHSQGAR